MRKTTWAPKKECLLSLCLDDFLLGFSKAPYVHLYIAFEKIPRLRLEEYRRHKKRKSPCFPLTLSEHSKKKSSKKNKSSFSLSLSLFPFNYNVYTTTNNNNNSAQGTICLKFSSFYDHKPDRGER